jgi:hypothetical protein
MQRAPSQKGIAAASAFVKQWRLPQQVATNLAHAFDDFARERHHPLPVGSACDHSAWQEWENGMCPDCGATAKSLREAH